ncbi:MT-A70-domain-containing protein [Aspergillus heterothallicus]
MSNTSVLYQNHEATVFLIDIPTSIALVQFNSQHTTPSNTLPTFYIKTQSQAQLNYTRRQLLSSPALEKPYPPTTEPKSAAARARVLQRIPCSEKEVSAAIEPVVLGALREIRNNYRGGRKWCFPRCLVVENADGEDGDGPSSQEAGGSVRLGKRRNREKEEVDLHQEHEQPMSHDEGVQTDLKQRLEAINQPPLILAPGLNKFEAESELRGHIVKNTSFETATVEISRRLDLDTTFPGSGKGQEGQTYIIPPLSSFLICNFPLSTPSRGKLNPIPGLSHTQKFNLILLDPPWSNRSVRRSRHYNTQAYSDSELLTEWIGNVLRVHSYSPFSDAGDCEDTPLTLEIEDDNDEGRGEEEAPTSKTSIAAIWITNSAKARKTAYDSLSIAGFTVLEEWVWIKTTVYGEPVMPVEGLWRKPYEVLVVGVKKMNGSTAATSADDPGLDLSAIRRRVIAAVPDVHSRKPNLREIFERLFFSSARDTERLSYEALEVFARNLTAGWWACGNEALEFNDGEWWVDSDA